MMVNALKIQAGFQELQEMFSAYIAREFRIQYGESDWWAQIRQTLSDQQRDLPLQGPWNDLVNFLDLANCIRVFDRRWNDIFKRKLSVDYRIWAKELMGVRNRLSHMGADDFSEDDTWRALDTAARLCDAFDDEAAERIRGILRELRYGSSAGSGGMSASSPPPPEKKNDGILVQPSQSGLPSWRDVIEPHPDVAQGRYKNAEFAADLAQVARGEGSYEYRDPVEFFARTYVTEGMMGLLTQGLRRITGMDGEPVIQLKTAFGGGKTHSMLALYHLLQGKVSADRIPGIRAILDAVGISALPKARVAVLVGSALDPSHYRRPNNMPGITINTLWGEMAAQLALAAGDLSLYDIVRESDRRGVSPGSVALKELFDACGPCLVLMDELVAYAKKLYGAKNLPAGTFDNFITFIQEVTEAARASKNSLVVASIPESNIEIGGEAGQTALEAIEHTFGRMEAIWKPVASNEGFEVVRRRLFLDCKDTGKRDYVCSQFSQMYNASPGDFPPEAKEVSYRERMISCYPIHPEVFDRLYEDWATLERFQRTRGVLRLMAGVIHELWMGNDASAMIMPGSIGLDVPTIRDELTRHLNEGWNAIVDREVDGKKSIPYQKDREIPRYGKSLASRRVARTIMLGSAPTNRSQAVRGIEASRIRLGVVQPGENVADFNDALNTLRSSLAYLYSNPNGNRFWFDTRPTLRKTVEDRMTQIPDSDVELKIQRRLSSIRKEAPFAGVHACPASSLDVPDDQSVRLVLLRPEDYYRGSLKNPKALTAAENILNNRGTSPRTCRNMLVFLAADGDTLQSLQQEVRRCRAWQSIQDDKEALNLDNAQIRETDTNLKSSSQSVDRLLNDTWCWLLVPRIDRDTDLSCILWDRFRISGGEESPVRKAADKLIQEEALITRWAPVNLWLELEDVLWTNTTHITVRQLWDFFCTYCYLPRLAGYSVLEETIRTGVRTDEYFALAAGYKDGRFIDLKFNEDIPTVDRTACLVKMDVAKKQIQEDEEERRRKEQEAKDERRRQGGSSVSPQAGTGTGSGTETTPTVNPPITPPEPPTPPPPPKDTRFFMSAPLDTTRIGRDVQRLVEEIISHLTDTDGAQVTLNLEVSAESPDGFSDSTVRTVQENCQTLRIRNCGFEP